MYERRNGRLTPVDLDFVNEEAASLLQLTREHPELGIKSIETHRSLEIGARLIGSSADGRSQAVLSIVSLESTYLARKTQVVVDRLMDWVKTNGSAPPPGLRRVVTGSAAVGHDTSAATNESIENSTTTTIALVILILLLVYRSPLLAMVPLVTIALSVFASLRLIALLTRVPGLGFQAINITQLFVVVVLFGAGTDYCLFLVARYREELGLGRAKGEALREAIRQVGAALVASAATVIVGLGMLRFSSFATIRHTGPAIALSLVVALAAALTLAPAMLAWFGALFFWPSRASRHRLGRNRGTNGRVALAPAGFWVRVADLVVGYPLLIWAVCLLILVPLAVAGAAPGRTTASSPTLIRPGRA